MTSFPKTKRIIDRELLNSYHNKPCAISNYGCNGLVSGHHIKTKGSGGNDTIDNILALCFFHHRQIHNLGTSKFLEKYPDLISILAKKSK